MYKIGPKGLYIKYVGGGLEGFCRGHEIFQAYIDGPWIIFQSFCWATKYFHMFLKLKELKHKISKLAIKEI